MPTVIVSAPLHPAWLAANAQLILTAPVEVQLTIGGGVAGVGLGGRGTVKKVVAAGGVAAVGLGGRTTPARKVAQTGRVAVGLSAVCEAGTTVATGSFTHVTVTRDYDLASGDAPTGTVYFTPSAWLQNNGVTLVPAAVPAALDSLGQISVALVANDDADTLPEDSFYTVREVITGQAVRSYRVVIPHNAGSTVDLSTLPVL